MNKLKKSVLLLLIVSIPLAMTHAKKDSWWQKAKNKLKEWSQTVKKDVQKVEEKVKDDLDKAGQALRDAAQKVEKKFNLDFIKDDTVKNIIKLILALDPKQGLQIIKRITAQKANDPYYDKHGTVSHNPGPTTLEKQFLQARDPNTFEALSKLLNTNKNKLLKDPVRVGISFSGGGYRSISWGMGALLGLDELGILDATTCMAGVSGGAWLLTSWIKHGTDTKQFGQLLNANLSNRLFENLKLVKVLELALAYLLDGKKMGPVDLFGIGLAGPLLDHDYTLRLVDFQQQMLTGKRPLPIFNAGGAVDPTNISFAASPLNTRINVFNPAQKTYSSTTIPPWATGNKWSGGVSQTGLSTTLATISAICGSAFTVSVLETIERYERFLIKILGKKLFNKLYTKLDSTNVGKFRVLPFPLPNPNYEIAGQVFSNKLNFPLTDEGVKCNLGGNRSVSAMLGSAIGSIKPRKIIFVIDASGGHSATVASSLKKEDEQQRKMVEAGIPGFTQLYPDIDYSTIKDKELHIFQNDDSMIVLLPFLNQSQYGSSNTFKTDYKGKQADMLRMVYKSFGVIKENKKEILSSMTKFIRRERSTPAQKAAAKQLANKVRPPRKYDAKKPLQIEQLEKVLQQLPKHQPIQPGKHQMIA
ncbi:hypothetical protein HOF26_03560 [bacterium]|nr:hypothetical protein [bacterium]